MHERSQRSQKPVHERSQKPVHERSQKPVHERSQRSQKPVHERSQKPVHERSQKPVHNLAILQPRDYQLLQFSVGVRACVRVCMYECVCVCVSVCMSGTELRLSWNRLHHSLRYPATKYSLRGQIHPIGSGLRTNESLTSFKTYGRDDCLHGRAEPHTRQPSLRAAPLTKGTTRGPRTNRKTHKTATHAGRQICILKLHKSRGKAATESGCSNSQDGAVLCLRVFVFLLLLLFQRSSLIDLRNGYKPGNGFNMTHTLCTRMICRDNFQLTQSLASSRLFSQTPPPPPPPPPDLGKKSR